MLLSMTTYITAMDESPQSVLAEMEPRTYGDAPHRVSDYALCAVVGISYASVAIFVKSLWCKTSMLPVVAWQGHEMGSM